MEMETFRLSSKKLPTIFFADRLISLHCAETFILVPEKLCNLLISSRKSL